MQQVSYQIGDAMYLSITDRCTLVCEFCPKTQGILEVQGYDLSMDHRPEVDEIVASIDDPARYSEVVFCGYGEPTLRLKTLLAVGERLKAKGARLRLNTDGLGNLVHKRNILPELGTVIDSVSVSLNAQDEATYNRHCQPQLSGSYAAMLAFLREAPEHIEQVTATAIDGLPGVDIEACRRLAEQDLGVMFRRRVLDRVG